jgi:tRNA (guanine-N7-)-methyltransferase
MNLSGLNQTQFRLRSYVPRGRRTPAQERAYLELWPQYGMSLEAGQLNDQQVFGREAPCYLEIGFGSGQSLLALALSQPDWNFIGVETHQPGIGALLQGIQLHQLTNIRIFYGDVIDILEKCLPFSSLDGVQIFFPDPWPKRRHHQRRLIQPDFLVLVKERLKTNGVFHLATDWEDYAHHMMEVASQEKAFTNLAGLSQFANRSVYRPVVTKFEQRAMLSVRQIWELQFMKQCHGVSDPT